MSVKCNREDCAYLVNNSCECEPYGIELDDKGAVWTLYRT